MITESPELARYLSTTLTMDDSQLDQLPPLDECSDGNKAEAYSSLTVLLLGPPFYMPYVSN